MTLATLQRALEQLHGIETDLDVRDFLVPKQALGEVETPELLLVREVDDGVDIGLYLAPEVVTALEAGPASLATYSVAVEGVSHFVMLIDRARQGRPITALELEILAEVDKCMVIWPLLSPGGLLRPDIGRRLCHQLFERYELHEELSGELAARYHVATRVARRFCARLIQRYADHQDARRTTEQVRIFRRRCLAEKLAA